MAERNDQIFQLSLTELAFTIAFMLLLLLGYLIFKEQSARIAAESALSDEQSVDRAISALEDAKDDFAAALIAQGVVNPNDIVTRFIAAEDVRAERDRLRRQVEDLDAKLTALEELQKILEAAAQQDQPGITQSAVSSALAFQQEVLEVLDDLEAQTAASVSERALPPDSNPMGSDPNTNIAASSPAPSSVNPNANSADAPGEAEESAGAATPQRNREALDTIRQALAIASELEQQLGSEPSTGLAPSQESQTIGDIVSAARAFQEMSQSGVNPVDLQSVNSDLRGQVSFLRNRLNARGGRDFPPCWADETGKIEYLFAVELTPDSIVVSPAWPTTRADAAAALPNLSELVAESHSHQVFEDLVTAILDWSKSQDPECRHYVQLKSSITDAAQSDRVRLMVEDYFYKLEVPR